MLFAIRSFYLIFVEDNNEEPQGEPQFRIFSVEADIEIAQASLEGKRLDANLKSAHGLLDSVLVKNRSVDLAGCLFCSLVAVAYETKAQSTVGYAEALC